MRTTLDYISGHVNSTGKNDHSIPIPCDWVASKKLIMQDFSTWIPDELVKDPNFCHLGMHTDQLMSKFKQRKR